MFKTEGSLSSRITNFMRPQPPRTAEATPSRPSMPGDQLALSGDRPQPTFKTDGLTEEEVSLVKARLLPENYSDLKACMQTKGKAAAIDLARAGKSGPFAPSYGDPEAMLQGAREIQSHPELLRLVQTIRKGDILVDCGNNDSDPIPSLTRGPFSHAVICTSEGPPAEFVEAIGMTGDPNEATANQVRRCTLSSQAYDSQTVRLLRPTEGMSEPERSQAIDRAVRYAETQLGKPYDYSFTDNNHGTGLTDAYYCSELAYLSYASPDGANLDLRVSKSAERDSMIVSLSALLDALQPKDKAALMDKTVKFLMGSPKPGANDLVNFTVDEIMTECQLTEKVSRTPEDRSRLKGAVEKLMTGKGFPKMGQAISDYQAAEQRHDFDQPVIGPERRIAARMAIQTAFAVDVAHLFGTSGVDYFQAARTLKTVAVAMLPYSQTLSSYLYGPKDKRTEILGKVLDGMDWIKQHAPKLPFIGDMGLGSLPGHARPEIKQDFVSPSDLAWADIWHQDFNVKPGHPLDPPKS